MPLCCTRSALWSGSHPIVTSAQPGSRLVALSQPTEHGCCGRRGSLACHGPRLPVLDHGNRSRHRSHRLTRPCAPDRHYPQSDSSPHDKARPSDHDITDGRSERLTLPLTVRGELETLLCTAVGCHLLARRRSPVRRVVRLGPDAGSPPPTAPQAAAERRGCSRTWTSYARVTWSIVLASVTGSART